MRLVRRTAWSDRVCVRRRLGGWRRLHLLLFCARAVVDMQGERTGYNRCADGMGAQGLKAAKG